MSETEQEIFVTFDNNGNTLTDAQGRRFTWDLENRLVQAVVSGNNGGTTTFRYDPFGRRIQKSGPLGTTNYLYDGPDVVQEVASGGSILARYAHGRLMDEPLSQIQNGTAVRYEADGMGSVTSLSSSTGTIASTYNQDSFGKATAFTGTITNPFQYTGREFDQETGIYFYRTRYYDSTSGRFLSEDSLRFSGGVNFYQYVLNNPVAFVDPFGLCPTPPEKNARLAQIIKQLRNCPQYSKIGDELAQMVDEGRITTDPNQDPYGWYHPWSDTITFSPDALENDPLTPIHELAHRHQTAQVGGRFWRPVGAFGMLIGSAEGGVSMLWDRYMENRPLSQGFVENAAQAWAEKIAAACGIK